MLKFDHVAIGVRDHREPLHTLTGDLGGLVISGGQPPESGFRALQVRLGRGSAGMTVEILEPFEPESNDFLDRFLDAGGDRPHHITFKTPDIESELARLQGLGIQPVAIDFSTPSWQEMFIHPKDGHGTVIQIAQTDKPDPPMDEWLATLPKSMFMYDGARWWDEPSQPSGVAAELHRVVIATGDRAVGDRFYTEILGSSASASGDHTDHTWPGGVIRLVDVTVARPHVSHLALARGAKDAAIGAARFVAEA